MSPAWRARQDVAAKFPRLEPLPRAQILAKPEELSRLGEDPAERDACFSQRGRMEKFLRSQIATSNPITSLSEG